MEDLSESKNTNAEISQSEVENKANSVENTEITSAIAPEVIAEKSQEPLTAVHNEETVEEGKEEEGVVEKMVEEEPVADYSNFSREELLTALKELLTNDVNQIKNRIGLLKTAFNAATKEFQKIAFEKYIAEGGNKDEYQYPEDRVNEEFKKNFNIYKEKRQQYLDEQEIIKTKNLALKQEILEELKKLVDSEDTLKKTYDNFNALQEKWKSIGDVPRTEINNLWQSYHFLIEKFFTKVKINKELKMLDLKRNLEQKIELCEKVEELIMETSITKSFKLLQEYREQWKEIGPVPSDKNDEIWTRFCNAAEQIDMRRKEYYEQRKEELDKNLLAKTALCEKADELVAQNPESINEWNNISNELNDLLKVWKTIGSVPKEVNEEIWLRFKSALDKFFEAKKEHFDKLKDEQTNNYNLKIDLCLQAEAIAKRDDWKYATDELLKLQNNWKSIGSVSRKVSDKVWLRFRSACDDFFARKAEFYSTLKSSELENLAKKREIIENVKSFEFGEDKNENLNIIKDFQRKWVEIGHVPIAEKDNLQKEFRDAINTHFEKLKISAREAQETIYRERLKNISGDISRFASEERRELSDKIQKLKNDLILWENNLGFLANSKQASLLKEEFEKKMQSARQQIALLEAKLKILIETKNESENKKENPAEGK